MLSTNSMIVLYHWCQAALVRFKNSRTHAKLLSAVSLKKHVATYESRICRKTINTWRMRAIHESLSMINSSESWSDTLNSYSWFSWENEILIWEHKWSSLSTRWSSSMKTRSFYNMSYFLLQKREMRLLWTSQLMKLKLMIEAFERWLKCSCSQELQCRCNHLNWWLKNAYSHETDDWNIIAIIKLMIEEFMQFRMNMTESFLIRSLNVALA